MPGHPGLPAGSVPLCFSPVGQKTLPSSPLFHSPPLGSLGKVRGGGTWGLESNDGVTISVQWLSSWVTLGKSLCLSGPVVSSGMKDRVFTS